MVKTMRSLKTISRASNVSILITVDPELVKASVVNYLIRLSDLSISMTSFALTDDLSMNALKSQYSGLLRVLRTPDLNTLTGTRPALSTYAYRSNK